MPTTTIDFFCPEHGISRDTDACDDCDASDPGADAVRDADLRAYDDDARTERTSGERAMDQLAEATFLAGNMTPCEREREKVCVSLYVGDMGPFYLTIKPANNADRWGVWAQTYIASPAEHKAGELGHCCGNRCGARNTLVQLFTPAVVRAMAGVDTDKAADDEACEIAAMAIA